MRQRNAALDGLRAWAVLAVMAYHQPFAAFRGGFLAVTSFFTLSGFLIGGLLLAELQRADRLDLRRFYVRRARRLLPAAYVTIVAAVVVWRLRGGLVPGADTVASLFYVQNWQLIRAGHSYGRLFVDPSPFEHLWTLAIEEQFYLVLPLVLAVAWRLARRRLSVVAVVLATLTLASWIFAPHGSGISPGVYYNSLARAGEFLTGALLAAATARWGATDGGRFGRNAVSWVAALGLMSMIVVVRLGDEATLPLWVALVAVLTALVIVGCLRDGALAQMLGGGPLPLIGRMSYAMYLVHWPLFLLLGDGWLGLHGLGLFAARLAATLLVAGALHALVEEPIRLDRRVRGARLAMACVPVLAVAVLGSVLAPHHAAGMAIDEGAIRADYAALVAGSAPQSVPTVTTEPATTVAKTDPVPTAEPDAATTSAPAPPPTTVVPTPQRVLFVGDSTSWTLSGGVRSAAVGQGTDVQSLPAIGCGIGGSTRIRYLGVEHASLPSCTKWRDDLVDVTAWYRPDVVVVSAGLADLADRDVGLGWEHVGEPAYDSWIGGQLTGFAEQFTAACISVVWLTMPHVDLAQQATAHGLAALPEGDPQRADRYNEIIDAGLGSMHGVTVVDFAGFLASRPGGEFAPGLRPDGVHLSSDRFPDVADWLLTQIDAAGSKPC